MQVALCQSLGIVPSLKVLRRSYSSYSMQGDAWHLEPFPVSTMVGVGFHNCTLIMVMMDSGSLLASLVIAIYSNVYKDSHLSLQEARYATLLL